MNRRHFIGLALAATASPVFAKPRNGLPRTLSLRHMYTDERVSLTYRVGDNYQRSALHKLNHFLRDFRTGDVTAIDPRLFDLLHDVKHRLGYEDGEFEIFSGYRSPKTNSMLRRTSSGVAKQSLHMVGQAIDIRLPGRPTRSLRDAVLTLGRGGVGYYRKSDFVHLDTGRVRTWGA